MPEGKEVSFEEFLERVEKVRALRSNKPVLGLRLEEDELIDHVERSFRKELPPHALEGTEAMLVALGTVPANFDFELAMLGLLRSQLAGLYDPRKDAMFVRSDLHGEELEATLLHELVHALQDQAYDLDEFSAYKEDGTDRASALSALAEGDATSAMYDGMLSLLAERQGGTAQSALDLPTAQLTAGMEAAAEVPEEGDVPRIVRRSLIAPYRDGLLFVHELRKRGGWKAVDEAWKHPPVSTEQVLHVKRYLDREPPLPVRIVAPPSKQWKKLLSDVWGEQSLRLVFEDSEPRVDAAERAAGWGGDRIAVFESGSARALSWHIIADDLDGAERYFEGFRKLSASQAQAEAVELEGEALCVERKDVGPLSIGRRGKHVIVLAGPYDRTPTQTASAGCPESAAWMKRSLNSL